MVSEVGPCLVGQRILTDFAYRAFFHREAERGGGDQEWLRCYDHFASAAPASGSAPPSRRHEMLPTGRFQALW